MLRYPEPEPSGELKIGDKVCAAADVPFYQGRIGTLIEIDDPTGSYTVQFSDGSHWSCDSDMLRRATIQPGRPVEYPDEERFHLRTLSRDLVTYIDDTRGHQSRRARLEEIIREHKQEHEGTHGK